MRASTSLADRAIRFLGVSILTAPIGQVLIYFFFAVVGMPGVVANALALVIIAIANLVLSLKYVWSIDGDEPVRRHVGVFILMSCIGLALSTIGVAVAVALSSSDFAANIGSLVGYGLGFVLRFVFLDRYFSGARESA